MGKLTGRVALVTGASRGLGAEIVRDLASEGADVAFTYAQDHDAAKKLAAEIEQMGRRTFPVIADVRSYDKAFQVVDDVVGEFGGLDVLVCNAGVARGAPVCEMGEPDWDDVMDVTLKGPFNYIRAVSPLFISRSSGKIVCIGSINGLRGRMGTISYNVAKAGLLGLVKTAARMEIGRMIQP